MKCVSNTNAEVFTGLCFDLPLKWHLSLDTHRQDEICCWLGLDKEVEGLFEIICKIFIHRFLGYLEILGGVSIFQKQLSFLIISLAEIMGKSVPDKLSKQCSIFVPLIPKPFSHTSVMGNGNHKLGNTYVLEHFLSCPPCCIPLSVHTCEHLVSPFYHQNKRKIDSKCFLCNCQIF